MSDTPDPVRLADLLDDLRARLPRLGESGFKGLADWRANLERLQSESVGLGDPAASESLQRLALLVEVWECLAADQPGPSEEVREFLDQALGQLASGCRDGSPDESAAWIQDESATRWGEYLGLVDSTWAPESGEGPTDFAADLPLAEAGPAIDPAVLLRLLTGSPTPNGAAEPKGAPPSPTSSPLDHLQPLGSDLPAATAQTQESVPIRTPPASVPPRSAPRAPEPFLSLDPELREVFLVDAADLFERIEGLTLELGQGPDQDRLRELGRCFHTLKGAAGSVGLTDLSSEIHTLEDRLGTAGKKASSDLVQQIEGVLRSIEAMLAGLKSQAKTDAPGVPEPSRGRLDTPLERTLIPPEPGEDDPRPAPAPTEEADGLIRVPSSRIEELMDLASELMARRRFWGEQARVVGQCATAARECGQRLKAQIERERESGPGSTPLGKDEGLLARFREQAEDLAVLAATARKAASAMADEGEALTHLSQQAWQALQSVQVVPIRGLFRRLVRAARDAARVEERQIEVELKGEAICLDRSTQDRAYEPLLHVVRNAVGHGIESPGERARQGKPPAGRVTLEARREGNVVTLAVSDDGRGLDYQAIAAKGRRLGLLGPLEEPDIDRLQALVFHPGFSTRQEANSLAGRGVGMDVVASEVGRLRGTVNLSSRTGLGTRLTISLPARLALEQMMVVRVGSQAFALSIESIRAVAQPDDLSRSGAGVPDRIEVQGQRLPLVDVRSVLGFSGTGAPSCSTVLVIPIEGEPTAFLVDAIDGPCELVIRPLGPLLAGHPAVSGTSLMPTGEVVLALHPAGLARAARANPRTTSPARPPLDQERPAALVVDDSISVRRIAARSLLALGFDVDEAADGEQALRNLRGRSYRLVLTDLEMPRMDGFELLAEMGRTGVLRSTSAIVASSLTDPDSQHRVLSLGALAFVSKPVSPDELARVVARLTTPTAAPA